MRRSKPKVVWLPQDNINSLGVAGNSVYQVFSVDPAGAPGDFAVGEIPLVIDNPPEATTVGTTLADIYSSGYRLRRIVGKIFVGCQQLAEDTPGSLAVTAGLIVRRVDPATGGSLALASGTAELLSPGQIENTADPWIWRRTWIVGNNLATVATPFQLNSDIPENNIGSFAAVDGPHVDQKTARLIGPEERLFLNLSATIITAGMDQQIATNVRVVTDLRVLGSMRTMVGNRRNASR